MKLSFFANTLLILASALFVMSSASAKSMYKWVDEHGKVSFSDQVPPNKAALGHQELDKNAQVVNVAKKAKTSSELELEKRIIALKKHYDDLIVKQKNYDKKLLSRYLNEKALDSIKQAEMLALSDKARENQEALKKGEAELLAQQTEVASFDAKKTKAPPALVHQLAATQKNLAKLKQTQTTLQQNKLDVEKQFAADKARYLVLKSQANPALSETPPGMISCETTQRCESAWEFAKTFVKGNSIAQIVVESDNALISEAPALETDLSLSVAKMPSGDKKMDVLLDIQCANTEAGKALCLGTQAHAIKVKFNEEINAKLMTGAK